MAFLRIIRFANCLFVFLCIFASAYFKKEYVFDLAPVFAGLAAAFIAAFGYVINDIVDIKIDKINKPERVLASGSMSKSTALIYSIVLVSVGLYFATKIDNIYIMYLAIINAFALFVYAYSLKKVPLIGNLVVALLAGSTFIFGGISNANMMNVIPIAIMATIFTLIREIVKDAEDVHGDSSYGAKTLPIIFSRAFSLDLVGVLTSLLLGSIIYFYSVNELMLRSIILLVILVIIPMYILTYKNKQKIGTIALRKFSMFVKIDMLILLLVTFWGER